MLGAKWELFGAVGAVFTGCVALCGPAIIVSTDSYKCCILS